MRSGLLALVVAAALGCAGPGPRPGPDAERPEAALRAFAAALQDGRHDAARALLSERWRSEYTPRRLAVDLEGAGPSGREAVGRALAALEAGATMERSGDTARLPLGGGRAAVLVREREGWRVDALE